MGYYNGFNESAKHHDDFRANDKKNDGQCDYDFPEENRPRIIGPAMQSKLNHKIYITGRLSNPPVWCGEPSNASTGEDTRA